MVCIMPLGDHSYEAIKMLITHAVYYIKTQYAILFMQHWGK